MEKRIFQILAILLATLACLYLYFITGTVLNVIARKDALGKITKMQASIGSMEQQYLASAQAVTPADAAALGLTTLASTKYVYRPGNVGMRVTATIARNEN